MKLADASAEDGQQRREARTEIVRESGGIVPTKRKAIAVLTPTLGQISMWWTVGLLDLVWPMNTSRAFMPLVDQRGDNIGETRNRLVKMVLDSEQATNVEIEYVMWLDDDVIIQRPVLLALLSHDRDIASGVYFSKTDHAEPLIFSGPGSGSLKFKPDEIFEAWGWSNGLCVIKTAVYKRMMDELDLGVDQYGNPCFYKQPDFGVNEQGNLQLGGTEDFHFFENCSKLGYRPIIDCRKHAFGFHYDAEAKTAYPKPQWQQFLRREPIVWPKPEGGEVVWA